MALENKLGITDSAELARAEEKISKTKAIELFENGIPDTFEIGTFRGLSQIHEYLFLRYTILQGNCGSSCCSHCGTDCGNDYNADGHSKK